VFKLDPAGTLTTLYSFTGGAAGAYPVAGVVRDSEANLYGTTEAGGIGPTTASGAGVVFKVDASGTYSVLYSFTGGADGASPVAGPGLGPGRQSLRHYRGRRCRQAFSWLGSGVRAGCGRHGDGAVQFHREGGRGDPFLAGLIRDSAGNLYGATSSGGRVGGESGYGVVFELDAAGAYSVLHTFRASPGGANPHAGLIRDAAGNLYGTTFDGGADGAGVVFNLKP